MDIADEDLEIAAFDAANYIRDRDEVCGYLNIALEEDNRDLSRLWRAVQACYRATRRFEPTVERDRLGEEIAATPSFDAVLFPLALTQMGLESASTERGRYFRIASPPLAAAG